MLWADGAVFCEVITTTIIIIVITILEYCNL